MGFNDVAEQKIPPYPSVNHMEHQGYSIAFQLNVNLMLIVPFIFLVLYGIYRILLKVYIKQKLDGKTSS